MHIHGAGQNPYTNNFYSVAQEEKAAAAQRAANVRKKLLKGAQSSDLELSPEADLLVGRWMAERQVEDSDTPQNPFLADV